MRARTVAAKGSLGVDDPRVALESQDLGHFVDGVALARWDPAHVHAGNDHIDAGE